MENHFVAIFNEKQDANMRLKLSHHLYLTFVDFLIRVQTMADEEDFPVEEEDEEISEGDKKKAQAALHFTVGRIAEEEFPDGQISRVAVAALTELTMGYMGIVIDFFFPPNIHQHL